MEGQQRHILQRLLPLVALAIFALALWVLVREIRTISVSDIVAEFRSLPATVLLVSGLLSAASYGILTLYDYLALHYVGAGLKYRRVAPIAFSAFAVGHNVGLASLSGGAIRYRAYSLAGLTTSQIALVIAFLPLTYDLGAALLIGITLLLEPAAVAVLPLNSTLIQVIGVLLLSIPVIYLLWLTREPGPLRIRGWDIRPPTVGVGVSQIALYCADLLVASSVLFVLLQSSVDLAFLPFLGAYLLAIVAGVISNVPGALGVFESALLLLLPDIPVAVLLGSILAYRLIYYLIPLLLALLLIVAHELLEHRETLATISGRSVAWGSRLVPTSLSAAVFLLGAYLLIGAVLPFATPGQGSVRAMVSLPVVEISHLLGSAVGIGLLLLARGLYRRLHGALVATLVLLSIASLVLIIHRGSLAQAGIPLLMLGLAWLSRSEFHREKSLLDERLEFAWILGISVVLLVSLGLGYLVHGPETYSGRLWWQFSHAGDAPRVLRASLLVVTIAGMFAWFRLARARPATGTGTAAEQLARIRPIIAAAARSSANVALSGDKELLFHPAGDAVLMYQRTGDSLVALGDPLGNPGRFEELAWSFRELCDTGNAHCVFYEVSDAWLPIYIDLGLSFSRLGEEARVELAAFDPADRDRVVADARLAFEVVPAAGVPDIIDQLERVSDEWLAANRVQEKGFSLGFFAADYLANFDCAVLRQGGEIVAFANLWQGAGLEELSIDLMRFADAAPADAMDEMFCRIMSWGKARGFKWFSLGLAPLAQPEQHDALAPLWHRLGNLVYPFGESFQSFEELRDYVAKFEPVWEPRYLASEGGLDLPATLIATTRLISGQGMAAVSRSGNSGTTASAFS